MKVITITIFFTLLFFSNNLVGQSTDLRNLDIEKFKERCLTKFCTNGNNTSCKEKIKNLQILANFIKNDRRVTNIDIAAFLFATVYTETAVRDFNPTEEIGKGRGKKYGNPDIKTGKIYYGRGWIQLTHKENYKKAADSLRIDLINNPSLALEPKHAYEIMYIFTTNGWLETYRSSSTGAGGKVPIKITDFLDKDGNLDHSLTRAVINANAVGQNPLRFEFKAGCFIPTYEYLDASKKNKDISIFFKDALLYGLEKKSEEKSIKLLPLIEHNNTPSAGCFMQDSMGRVYGQLYPLDGYFFNLKGWEERFEEINDKKQFPNGYNYGFRNKDTTIFVKEIVIESYQSYQTNKYEIIIRTNGQEFKQILEGFCGS